MKKFALLALSPFLLANQFTASEFEFSAHFIALIQQRQVEGAKLMLAPNVVIKSWADYDGPDKSFESFVTYITKCPVHDFEGVDTKDAHNINVNLDCPGYGGASLIFDRGKISEIDYGGPPPLVRTNINPQR